MTMIIDSHEDIAFEAISNQRDYTLSAMVNRQKEGSQAAYGTTLGWPEYQKAQVGVIASTIFIDPTIVGNEYETRTCRENWRKAIMEQLDFYQRWNDTIPDKFHIIRNKKAFEETVDTWNKTPANYPEKTNAVGLIILWEGAEGLRSFEDLDEYWERGMRLIGPVWGGGRWCGASRDNERFSDEGKELLERMADKGFILDIAHMNTVSCLEALDRYEGVVVATHANCRALLKDTGKSFHNNGKPTIQIYERQLSDETIARLIERDGVMGVIPCNDFLNNDWTKSSPREMVTINTLAHHIDHICQIAGNADHAAIGSDLDGGFGYPEIPYEMNDISDLPVLRNALRALGYTENDIEKVFWKNWHRIYTRGLP